MKKRNKNVAFYQWPRKSKEIKQKLLVVINEFGTVMGYKMKAKKNQLCCYILGAHWK